MSADNKAADKEEREYRVNLKQLADLAEHIAYENVQLRTKIATAQKILDEPMLPNYDPQHRLDRIREALK